MLFFQARRYHSFSILYCVSSFVLSCCRALPLSYPYGLIAERSHYLHQSLPISPSTNSVCPWRFVANRTSSLAGLLNLKPRHPLALCPHARCCKRRTTTRKYTSLLFPPRNRRGRLGPTPAGPIKFNDHRGASNTGIAMTDGCARR